MRRAASFLLVFALAGFAHAQSSVPDCVEVQAHARFAAAAYNHWVRVENRCARAVTCSVATDVNPEAQRLRVAAGEAEEVLTFRGSPAREFTPRVRCTEE